MIPNSHFQSQEGGVVRLAAADVPYTVHRSRRRRRSISISYGLEHGLRILVPLRTPPQRIALLLRHRHGWIEHRFEELARLPRISSVDEFADGAVIPYLDEMLRLRIIEKPKTRARCEKIGDVLEVTVKPGSDVRKAVLNWYKTRAKAVCGERMDFWAEKIGVSYRRLLITNARRLWGSCSARNDIRINWRIMMAPMTLVDCLLAHELCHVVHKNHSQRFWRLMEKTIPDHAQRRQQMRALESDLLRRGR